jgi:ferredoxin-NADP reductase
MNARLIKCDQIAEGTIGFTIEVDGPFEFRPGQACDLTLVNPKYQDDKGSVRTFSICSVPGEAPRLSFATRQTGSAFKRSVQDAAADLAINVDEAFGDFLLHDDASRLAVFLAGGIGITPFRSIIKNAVERRLAQPIALLYSNRNKASAAFMHDLESWADLKRNFTFIPTLTDAHVDGWTGRTGVIDSALIAAQRGAGPSPIYYAAGPEAFVAGMKHAMFDARVPQDDIRTDEFPGY